MTRVALAHDYLTQRGGAERVALVLTQVFPGADLYTSLYDPDETYPEFRGVRVVTSPLNRVGLFRRAFRWALPFFGAAFDRAPVDPSTEVVVVSTTGFAHGIATSAPKVVYCHSPARFLYLVDDYLGTDWWRTPTGWGLMALRPWLVRWDQRAAHQAAVYLCNSRVVQRRIRDVYGIEATVVPPPAALDPSAIQEPLPALDGWPDHHLLVSRLLPYKNVDAAIDAFRQLPDERLLVVGSGPLRDRLAADLPVNVRLVEGITDAQLRTAYAGARAVIAPSHEDFGLTPVEGFSFGVPALALRAGGYLDTVVEGVSGWFFDAPTADDIAAAVRRLARLPLDRNMVLAQAQHFTPEAFAASIRGIVDQIAGGST
ncbi:glycosyltransferase [Propionibacteriaceae bacterium G57]|uniref:glycosyltransferase n=1 Tax=Aestuariimicrobium sp. G57 TaxID=3418485 RepID=UPI003DA77575